jgi:hypothetical protein
MNFGFWNFYPAFNQTGCLPNRFQTQGHDWAASSRLLGQTLQSMGHQVATLDMKPLEWFDKVFFIDYPRAFTHSYRYFRELLRVRASGHQPHHLRAAHRAARQLCPKSPQAVSPGADLQKGFVRQGPFQIRPFRNCRACRSQRWSRCAFRPAQTLLLDPKLHGSEQTQRIIFRARAGRPLVRGQCAAGFRFDGNGVGPNIVAGTAFLSEFRLARRLPPSVAAERRSSSAASPPTSGPMSKANTELCWITAFVLPTRTRWSAITSRRSSLIVFTPVACRFISARPTSRTTFRPTLLLTRRKFSYEELYRYISAMSEKEYQGYLASSRGVSAQSGPAAIHARRLCGNFRQEFRPGQIVYGIKMIFPDAPGSMMSSWARDASAKGSSRAITGLTVPFSNPAPKAA